MSRYLYLYYNNSNSYFNLQEGASCITGMHFSPSCKLVEKCTKPIGLKTMNFNELIQVFFYFSSFMCCNYSNQMSRKLSRASTKRKGQILIPVLWEDSLLKLKPLFELLWYFSIFLLLCVVITLIE